LVYINIMLNLFIAIFRTNICSFDYLSYTTPKLQSIEAQHPLRIFPCLCVIARTNESQVGILPYINKKFNLFIATFRTDICSCDYLSYTTPKLQSIEAQHPLPISPCLCVIARINESQVAFLPYINKMFNLFIATFRTDICSFVYFSYSTPKLQSIEAQQPLPISPCLCVIARTNESQVAFLLYINKIFNLFIAIFRTNICSCDYFSYTTPKLQSIGAQHPLPISPCLCVIARTNEGQVVFLPYTNKMFNLFIAIF